MLKAQAQIVWELDGADWTPERAEEVRSQVNDALTALGSTVAARQPGFKSRPDDNAEMWLKIKAAREA